MMSVGGNVECVGKHRHMTGYTCESLIRSYQITGCICTFVNDSEDLRMRKGGAIRNFLHAKHIHV
jgi:hypothetical protein